MKDICLRLDNKSENVLKENKDYYNLPDDASTFKRGLSMLDLFKSVLQAGGQIYVKIGNQEKVVHVN